MKRFISWFVAMFMMSVATLGVAQERGTADEAKAMVEKALAHVKAVGNDKAFEDFTAKDGKWQNKDLYVFVVNFEGVTTAHGANKALIGKNMFELKDPNGKLFIKEMAETAKAKGTGWVDYMFTDPATKKSGSKSSYVARIPGYEGFIGVGIYK